MKNTATRLRSLCAALAALVLLLALAVPAFAADGFADLYYLSLIHISEPTRR